MKRWTIVTYRGDQVVLRYDVWHWSRRKTERYQALVTEYLMSFEQPNSTLHVEVEPWA